MKVDAYDHYDALIFDMDGTLVDSGQLHEQAWIDTLEHYQLPLDRALMRSLAGVPTQQTIEKVGLHFATNIPDSSAASAYKESRVQDLFLEYIQATPLKAVAEHYYNKKPMAVGTGAYTREARLILKHCGLLDLMDYVVGADQVTRHKPAPDTFLFCAEQLDVAPSKCVVFEDSALGLKAAEDAGMRSVDVAKELNIHNNYFL